MVGTMNLTPTVIPDRRAGGFTLVELLVVTGVIAALIAILLPVLSRARQQSAQTAELAGMRQAMVAYVMYLSENRGRLLPGYVDDASLRYRDDLGREITTALPNLTNEANKRWPWALTSKLHVKIKGTLVVGERLEAFSNPYYQTAPYYQYFVSITPSFGYNMYGLGGQLSRATGAWQMPYPWSKCCVQRTSQVTRVSERIVFTSARGADPDQPGTVAQGYWKVTPPTISTELNVDGKWPAGPFAASKDPGVYGYVDPRWRGKANVAFLDGHCDQLTFDELRDMRRWVQPAVAAGDPNWTPTP